MNYKNIITIILFSLFASVAYYFNWFIWILSFIVSIWFYTIIFYSFHIIWKKLTKKEITDLYEYCKSFLFRLWLFIFITSWIIGSWAYLSNEVFKAEMPEYTISNWEKTVKFQAMVHIWSENFYKSVQNNLKKFKEEWWVYFFEWVRQWSEESMDKFNQALWMNFDEDLYKNVSKLYWVQYQNTNDFLWIVNDLDFNIDLSIDEIMNIYDERIDSQNKSNNSSEVIDANKQIIDLLSQLNEKELKLLVYINQAILNTIIWNEDIQSQLSKSIWKQDIFNVIIDDRDLHLAKEVNNSKYEKIYITYWLLHFKWFFNKLKDMDENWEIIEIKNLYPID